MENPIIDVEAETDRAEMDWAEVQKILSQTCNDPDLTFMSCHCLDRVLGEKDNNDCRVCPVYIKFAKEYPNHCPNYEKE